MTNPATTPSVVDRHRDAQLKFRVSPELDEAIAEAADVVGLPLETFMQQYLRAAAGLASVASLRPFSTRTDEGGTVEKNIHVTDEEREAFGEHAEVAEVSRAAWIRCALSAAVRKYVHR